MNSGFLTQIDQLKAWIKIEADISQAKFMSTATQLTSACRHCRFYSPEGRRGGQCQQLGVPVQSSWKPCPLAIPAFAPSWESLEGIMAWQDLAVAEVVPLTVPQACAG